MIALLLLLALAAGPDPGAAPPAAHAAPHAAPPAALQGTPQARFEAANAAYLAGDFDGAARAYRALLDEGWEGSALHLNMGNALLRAGARGQAMAAWHRALRLDPADADARFNLELAQGQNVDRLVGDADAPLAARLVERTSERLATGLFGAAWVGFWALLWLVGRAPRRARRPLGAAAALAALAALLGGALLAGKAAERRTPAAVVVAPAAPVREGPDRALKAAFDLHEGTAVEVLEARGDQARVRLRNGLGGWVAASDLEVL